jgi:hypothetical protein
MGKPTINISYCKKEILFSVFLFFLLTATSFAQSDKDRQPLENPRIGDTTTGEVQENSAYDFRNDAYRKTINKEQKAAQVVIRKDNPIYKQGSDKEVRKESMSTLSFNLFLYIVDKFRED